MGDVKLTQKADAQKVEGKRRGGRQRLRWRGEWEKEEWRTTAKDSRNWRLLVQKIVREQGGKRRGRKETMETETMATITPEDRDVKRRTTT